MMRNIQLDPEEQALLESVENGEWQPVPDMQTEIQRYQRYAVAVQNEQEVTIRLPQVDLLHIQQKASEAGVPYQIFIVQMLHHYLANQKLVQQQASPNA